MQAMLSSLQESQANANGGKVTADEWKTILVAVPLVVAAFTLLFLLPIAGHRFFSQQAEKSLTKTLDGLQLLSSADASAVSITFHTYYGLLVWTRQTKHEYWVSAADAPELLSRLLRFNLRWGIWGAGAAVVPFLTLLEFTRVSRSVNEQVARKA